MSEDTLFTQNMDTIFTDIHNFTKTDSLLGAPVVIGDKTLVPVISVTLGYGSPGMNKNNTSSVSGMGARITTNAVVVIDKSDNSTNMLTVGEKGNMTQMMDKIPEAISGIAQNMLGQQSQGGQQNQQQGPGSTTK